MNAEVGWKLSSMGLGYSSREWIFNHRNDGDGTGRWQAGFGMTGHDAPAAQNLGACDPIVVVDELLVVGWPDLTSFGIEMAAPKSPPIHDRQSAYAPGKAEWKAAGNRLTAAELQALTEEMAKSVRLRLPRKSTLRVR